MKVSSEWTRRRRFVTVLATIATALGLTALPATASAAGVTDPVGAAAPRLIKLHPDLGREALFGIAVAISGTTALVGAPQDDAPTNGSGSATVYVRAGATWVAQATLTPADSHTGDQFGNSVALDGDTAVIGARYDNNGGASDNGAAYVFVRSGSTWTEQAKLTPPRAESGSSFGYAVAVQGNVAVVTAPYSDRQDPAYVFVRSGTTWSQPALLFPTDDLRVGFGLSVALDQDTIVVGQFQVTRPPTQGAAYVFLRSGTRWTQQAKLASPAARGEDEFGGSVDISADTILVGAQLETHDGKMNAGAAYVFARTGILWTEQARLVDPAAQVFDEFGTAVALQGSTAVVGARYYERQSYAGQGAAYVFTRSGTSWRQRQLVLDPDPHGMDYFGSAVALDGRTMIVGAFFDGSGSAFIYYS